MTKETCAIAPSTRVIHNVPSHHATLRCMLILVLVGSDASYSYQSLPLATSHSMDTSTMPPKHVACCSVLQIGHWTLKNMAHYAHGSCARSKARYLCLHLVAIFLCRGTALPCFETKCCAPAKQYSTVRGGPRRGDTVDQNQTTKLLQCNI